MKLIYAYTRKGVEATHWDRDLAAASNDDYQIITFNHDHYLNPELYSDAVKLDRLYQQEHPGLMQMYADLRQLIAKEGADALLSFTYPPFHPDFLRTLTIYKVLFSGDDPGATYMRNIPYLHAYHHVFYLSHGYSRDMDLEEKMRYCGMRNVNWAPLGVFDFEFAPAKSRDALFAAPRDIDIVYVGGFFMQKLPLLTKIRKRFGNRLRIHGMFRAKHNLYLNVKHGFGQWIRPVSFEERVNLYQRAKIGFNVHWSQHGVGNQRLYHLPANGAMQICDCLGYGLEKIYEPDRELVGFRRDEELIEKIEYYLSHDDERIRIAKAGYDRTMDEYRIADVTRNICRQIEEGMRNIGWLRQ